MGAGGGTEGPPAGDPWIMLRGAGGDAGPPPYAKSTPPPIEAQRRVSLRQLPISPQVSKRVSRIKPLLMLRNHHAPLAQQFRSRQGGQRLRILVLHRVWRIQKHEIGNAPQRF